MLNEWPQALERYSQKHPREVLRVEVESGGSRDVVIIYRGFSSSLMRATPKDPNQPVIPAHAQLLRLDRLEAPWDPDHPQIIQANLDWLTIQELTEEG
ncbi:MAG: hypothetical protein NW237_02215 [Cyanobacteriota bacterium]|nr:hypothetical protein [Cyanobacteriota bacterium]